MPIKWRTFDQEKDFVEQANPDMPPEDRYDVTVTNVTQREVKGKGGRITCEQTIDNGPHRPFCFEKEFWFSDTGKQDYVVAEMNAMFLAAKFSPVLPDDGDVTVKQLAMAIPLNELRFNVECIHRYQVKVWVDKNSYKSVNDDPEHGYTDRGVEKTDTLKYKKYLDVEKDAFDAWKAMKGEGFASLEPRRGSYVEMGLIYQPPVKDSERSSTKKEGERTATGDYGDDDLPF